MKTKNDSTKPFGIKDKLGYMFGDFGNDFFFMLVSSFLSVFYTNVLGISGAVVGTLFLAARFVDAFTDVGMGRIVDNSETTEEGRYRPWIRRMKLPVALAGIMMFLPWASKLPMALRIVYIFVTYILWGSVCYTGINIPYGSMASAMTDVPEERTALSTFRTMGAALAGVTVGALTPMIVYEKDASGAQVLVGSRVFLLAVIFAVFGFICHTICYRWCTERVQIAPKTEEKKQSPKELIHAPLHNRALISMIVAAIVSVVASTTTMSMNIYLYQDYFKNSGAMAIANMIQTVVVLLLAPFSSKLTKKFGKKEVGSVALIFAAVVYAIMFIIRIDNAWVFCAFLFVANIGAQAFNMVVWALISDIIDYQTAMTGSNDGGTVYGMYSFSRKLGQALAGGLGGFVLSAIGYQVSTGQAVVQTAQVTNSIYSVVTGVAAIGNLIAGLILMFWYPLSKKKMEEVQKKLKENA